MAIVFGERPQKGTVEQEVYYVPERDEVQGESPLFSQKELLAVQALGMVMHESARTKLRSDDERTYGFCSVENSQTDKFVDYDGSREEYLTFRVAKLAHNEWAMSVRFRQNSLHEDAKRTLHDEHYQFNWLRDGRRHGMYTLSTTDRTDVQKVVRTVYESRPVTDEDLLAVRARIHVHKSLKEMSSTIEELEDPDKRQREYALRLIEEKGL